MIRFILFAIYILCIGGCQEVITEEVSNLPLANNADVNLPQLQDKYQQQRNKIIKINFQPANAKPVDGYLIDSGLPFNNRNLLIKDTYDSPSNYGGR